MFPVAQRLSRRTTTELVAPNDIAARQERANPEKNLARMEQRVFLQLLITSRGLAVAFRWVDHATTGRALRSVRKTADPYQRGDRDDA